MEPPRTILNAISEEDFQVIGVGKISDIFAGQGVTDRPDGRLNAWILAWDVHALTHDPGRLFQAPIFHPLPDALAFSENLLLPAVLSAPALALGGPVLGYNVALLASLAVSGLGAQLLVRI